MMRNLERADTINQLGSQLRLTGKLENSLLELMVLTIARHWSAQYGLTIARHWSAQYE